MFPKKRSAPLRVTCVAVFIDTRLHQLCWIRRSVRIMTVGTGHFSFSKRHMGRAHELRFALEMALAADFSLCPLAKKRRALVDLGELVTVSGFFHERVAINATHATPRVRARFPVGLNSALMTAKTGFILPLHGLTSIFAESNHPTNALAAACRDVIASGTVTIFAGSLFSFVPWVVEKNFPHHGGGEFFKGGSVTSLADLVADISRRVKLRRFFFRGRKGLGKSEQEE